MSNVIVMDACALLALINNEDGANKVEIILREALKGNVYIYMNKINILEIYYGIYREEGQVKADEVYTRTLKQPIDIVETLNDDVFKEAGRLKAKYKLSLADSIVLGEAIVRNAVVLTCDHHEFDIIEQQEHIQFDWIR